MALTQAVYRFGSDTGTNETDHGWLAAQNTAISVGGAGVALDSVFLLRFGYQNNATAVSNINFTVQYKINSGSWVTITTSSAGVKAVAAAVLTNNGNTTNRLTGLSGTFQGATGQAEDGDAGGNSMDIASNGCAEAVFSIQVNSAGVSAGDVITFQSLQEGSALAGYTVTPTIYVAKTLSGATISSGLSLLAAVVTTGAVALSMPAIASTLDIRDSHTVSGAVAQDLSMGSSISPTSVLYAPTIPTMTVRVDEGATTRATRTFNLGPSYGTQEFALTTAERNAIGVWSNLRITAIANGDQAAISWAEVETPAAAAAQEVTGATIAAGSSLYDSHTVGRGAVTLLPPAISAGSSLYTAHTVAPGAVTLSGATIAAGSTVYDGHTVIPAAQTLLPPAIGAGTTVYDAHAITVGAVTLSLSTIAEGSTANDNHILTQGGGTQYATLPTIAAGSNLYTAHIVSPGAVTLTGATIAAGSSVTSAHAITTGAVSLTGATIAAGSALYAPVLPGLSVALYEGATLRGGPWSIPVTGSFTTFEYALTAGEKASISEWHSLRVSITADGVQQRITWVELETPAAATALSLPTIASGSAATPPGIDAIVLDPPTIASGSQVFAPGIVDVVVLVQLYEGTTLLAAFDAGTSSTYQTQTLTLDGGELDGVTNWSNLRVTVTGDEDVQRVSWIELETPTAAPLEPPAIASSAALYAPSLGAASVTLTVPTLTGTVVYAPTVAVGPAAIYGALLTVTPTLYAPSVGAAQSLTMTATIASGSTIAAPVVTVGVKTLISFAFVPGPAVLFQPRLDQTITTAYLDSTAALTAPVVAPVDEELGLSTIASGSVLTAPEVFAPTATLLPPQIASGVVLYGPLVTVAPSFLVGSTIASTVVLYSGSATTAAVTLRPPIIPDGSTIYAPEVVQGRLIYLPILSGGTVLYAPEVAFTFTGTVSTRRTYIPDAERRSFMPAAEQRTWVAT